MDRPRLLDQSGRPIVPWAVVEVCYRGTWRRGTVVRVYRKRLAVETFTLRAKHLITTYRKPGELVVVRGW